MLIASPSCLKLFYFDLAMEMDLEDEDEDHDELITCEGFEFVKWYVYSQELDELLWQ